MLPILSISAHAIDRWIERVDRTMSRPEARLAIVRFASLGKVSEKPRRWMRRVPQPGDRYIYSASRPGICLVVAADRTVVTVYSRDSASSRPRRRHLMLVPQPPPLRAQDVAHLRWRLGGAGSLADIDDDDLVA